MISLLFCSRARDNAACELVRLLDSLVQHTTDFERTQLEVLIKFDDDDTHRPADAVLASYPFPIRTYVWSRGEGRHALHHAQEYLFAQRDPRSRFCLMTADDFVFHRDGFVSEILAIPDEFCIIGCDRPPIEWFAGDYESEQAVRRWTRCFGPCSPVVSARLIEVCQNFGWQSNVDSWLIALCIIVYDLYQVRLWRQLEPFYERHGGYGLGDTDTYNNMEVTSQRGPLNGYWFELVRRQARNVYLNIEHGTAFENRSWTESPRKLLEKVRALRWSQLPQKVARRVVLAAQGLLALLAQPRMKRQHP